MQIKRYEVATMREAMSAIKKDLGADAIILSTKRLRDKPSVRIEVLAARDEGKGHPPCPDAPREEVGRTGNPAAPEGWRRCLEEIREIKALLATPPGGRPGDPAWIGLQETLDELCGMMAVQGRMTMQRNPVWLLYRELVHRGFSAKRASTLAGMWRNGDMPDSETVMRRIETEIAASLAKRKPVSRRIKAFIGPTGVGKTTTVAKLAARFALEERMRVGLVTTDTYRIAAQEQLKTYAGIMGLPVAVATEKEELARSLSRFDDRDIVLIDTPGRSPRDAEQLRKLSETLRITEPMENNLLLTVTAGRDNLEDTIGRYAIFPVDNIILTKIDECTRFGFICDVLDRADRPVAYWTTGQKVPQDLEKADMDKLAGMIVGQGVH